MCSISPSHTPAYVIPKSSTFSMSIPPAGEASIIKPDTPAIGLSLVLAYQTTVKKANFSTIQAPDTDTFEATEQKSISTASTPTK